MDYVQWEYHIEAMSPMSAEAKNMLNRLGADGWELVSVIENSRAAVLRREKLPGRPAPN